MYRLETGAYYSVLVKWLMWPGLGLMVAGGLTATATRWRVAVRALNSLRASDSPSPIAHLELPRRTWLVSMVLASLAVILVLQLRFGVAWYLGLVSVVLAFVLALIAVRATGETDLNPSGPMGSITQIGFGSLQAGLGTSGATAVTGNLLTGGISASAASEAADMMQDLKSGWMLGATPRRQVYAQLLGVMVGALCSVPILWVLLEAYELGSGDLPAPAGVTWSGLATMMTRGTAALPPGAVTGLAVGAGLGVVLAVVEALRPELARRFLPSAVALGVAQIVPFYYSCTILIGALLLVVIRTRKPLWIATYAVAVGAGAIAGEGLTGILAALVDLLL
jgi:OPT family oligopeptide transporter